MVSPGVQLQNLCEAGRGAVTLVAPFVKASALSRVLSKVNDDVVVDCTTRWRAEEILLGVSDLSVWSLLKDRPHSSLWLRPDLHAKFYRADEQCLVGSANLTNMALGWTNNANFELLVQLPAVELREFEETLKAGCIQVDESIFCQMSEAVMQLEKYRPELKPPPGESIVDVPFTENSISHPISPEAWLPTLRSPETLYVLYSGAEENLTIASRSAAQTDLDMLPVCPGLSREAFEVCVAAILLQRPTIRRVDEFVGTPQRFGAVRDLLSSLPSARYPGFNAVRSWQTLMRWLLYFLPNRYKLAVPRHSEVFFRVETHWPRN